MNNYLLKEMSSIDRFYELMTSLGYKQLLSPAVLAVALEIHASEVPSANLLMQIRTFFSDLGEVTPEGIETLPSAWLTKLPAILRQSRIPDGELSPGVIQAVTVEDGALRIEFPQEQSFLGDRITRWNQFRVVLNLALKPNLWTPLSTADEREIWHRRPDLRKELFASVFPALFEWPFQK